MASFDAPIIIGYGCGTEAVRITQLEVDGEVTIEYFTAGNLPEENGALGIDWSNPHTTCVVETPEEAWKLVGEELGLLKTEQKQRS